MTTVAVSFKGAQEKIPHEMVDLDIVKTKTGAMRVARLNFAITSGMILREKILGEIHKQAKSIHMSETDLLGMIKRAKEECIHR